MSIAHSKVTAQGQISVPAKVRTKLGIVPGSVIEWKEEDHRIVVRRVGKYSSEDVHHALFRQKTPKQRSLNALKEGVRRSIRKRHARR
jgi:antitoxin PrlF